MHPRPARAVLRTLRRLTFAGAAVAASATPASGQRSSGQGGLDPSTFPDEARALPAIRAPLFFPPYPPALGRAINRGVAPGNAQLPAAPAELAAHVNEIFYPALGSRLHAKSLKEPQRRQLDAYRAAKLALQNELRAELARLRDAGHGARALALTALARAQAPRLARLEQDAEQLRRDLMHGDHTWNTLREWRLGDHERRGYSPLEIAQVMRAYAYYQNGLLPAQRRLLREISIELLLSADDAAKATAAQPHVFFPPEPARVLFPESLSVEAAAKLAAYQTKKSQLKKELYDAVYRHDGETFSFLKGHTMTALAGRQAARLAELETLAEEIRRLLPPPRESIPLVERSPLPAALSARVAAMMNAFAAAQKDAAARVDAILARAKPLPLQATYRFEADGLKFVVVPTRSARGEPDAARRIEAVRTEIGAVAEDYGRQLAELIAERDAIRAEVAATLGLAKPETIDATLLAALRVANQRQNEAIYDEYRVAAFEPGLSPEQRRVLFDSVIERLELPLPRGELQPTRRGNSW